MTTEASQPGAARTVPSICRLCLAYCPIEVTVEGGRATRVVGDRQSGFYEGTTCPKGRALPAQHNDPQRLLRPLRRDAAGTLQPVASADALAEIAARLDAMRTAHGPRSVALYVGTGVVSHPVGPPMARAVWRAIGSPMVFSAATIDKPAANVSTALHGNWVAGAQTFETADVWMIVGANPLIARSNGLPVNNPGQRLKDAVARGLKLIVVDPRRTETARRAQLHLQARPGTDAVILAAMIRVIVDEGLVDADFVARHASGLAELRRAVEAFDLPAAAMHSGVPAETLREAALIFGRGRRGGVVCSTGASFSPDSNLIFYLALCLNTLCGRWACEGEMAPYPNVLLPVFTPKAQPYAPYPVFGAQRLRVHGLRENASGMPTAALADEILEPGEGRVRALFCLGGNPMLSWPDQARTEAALRALDLLVVFDHRVSATAALAHHVVPTPLTLELPGATQFVEALKYNGVSRGFDAPWAQYTPAVLPHPPGSDLVDEAAFFFRLAQRLGLQLDWVNLRGYGPHLEQPRESILLDMTREPSADELLALSCKDARVPLDAVMRHPHGRVFDEACVTVQPRDADCQARLQLADPLMLQDLAALAARASAAGGTSAWGLSGADTAAGRTWLLTCRRASGFMNSEGQTLPPPVGAAAANALFMHPDDLRRIGVDAGATVRLRSAAGTITLVAAPDDTVLRGTVAAHHGFGDPGPDGTPIGASVTRLVGMQGHDPVTGIPRMTGIAVTVEAA